MVSDCSSIQIKIQAHFDRSIHCQHNIANVAEIKYCLLFVSLKPSKESKKAEIRNITVSNRFFLLDFSLMSLQTAWRKESFCFGSCIIYSVNT